MSSRLHVRWGNPPHVTSPTCGFPLSCKQALTLKCCYVSIIDQLFSLFVLFSQHRYVLILKRTFPFKLRLFHVHTCVERVKFPWGLNWENKILILRCLLTEFPLNDHVSGMLPRYHLKKRFFCFFNCSQTIIQNYFCTMIIIIGLVLLISSIELT